MSEHARLSPSAAHRWIPCPGSVALEESLPKNDTSSVHSREGTAAHELAQWALSAPEHACENYVGCFATNGWEISREMAQDVQKYVNQIQDYAQGNLLLVERRIDFSEVIDVPNSFGTADAIILTADGKELMICDLKFGKSPSGMVHAERNEQLMIYALGAMWEHALTHDFERVRLVIHQPRLNHLSEWDCTMEELVEFSVTLKQRAQSAIGYDSAPPVFNPGEKQCRWCKASAICPALAAEVSEAIGGEFDSIEFSVPTNPAILSAKMNAINMIEAWCKAVRAEVERMLFAGDEVPGYKLVQGKQGNRSWTDNIGAEAVLRAMRLPLGEIFHMKLISPTDAEKMFKDLPRKWKKLEPFITRTPGSPSVAPASDKRQAITIEPVHFTPVDDSLEALL